MTATAERQQTKGSQRRTARTASIVPARPQVNLLPPEVRAKRALGRTKRWLAAGVVLALLVCAGVVVLTQMALQTAEQELTAEQSRTDELMAEKEKYAEVPLIRGELDRITTARELSMSTDVLWRDYVAAIAATSPQGVSLENLTVNIPSPMTGQGLPASPLDAAGVGTITFTANSATNPDTAAWVDGLEAVPGLADAWFTSASLTEVEDVAYYSVTGTVNISPEALSERFAPVEEEQQ